MGTSPPARPPLPDSAAPHGVVPSPPRYEVDPRGHRVEGRAAKVPGADLVRVASILDIAALAGLVAHLLVTAEDLILLPFAVAPLVPLVMLHVACASGMEEMTLRVRRIVGVFVPALVLAAAAAKGRLDELLGASLVWRLPLFTMPFGAFAAHRALRLGARASAQVLAARRSARMHAHPAHGAAPPPAAIAQRGGPDAARGGRRAVSRDPPGFPARRITPLGVLVAACGLFLAFVGAFEATTHFWWIGLVWLAAGVLCVALSRDIGAPSSDRRLRRGDRRNALVWLLPPLGVILGIVRLVWLLSRLP